MAWQEGGMKARLDLQQRQTLVMTPQLQMAIRLLQLTRMELTQEINMQMLENPLLEEVASDSLEEEPVESASNDGEEVTQSLDQQEETSELSDESDLKWDNYYEEEERERMESSRTSENNDEERPSTEQTLASPISLSNHLLWQLGLTSLSPREIEIGEAIIGNMDDHGYLEATNEEIAITVSASVEEIAKVLTLIQTFDPPGVGARNLIECLLIQIQALGLLNSLVETIIKSHLEEIEKKRYANIVRLCNVSMEEVLQAAKIIEHLEPKPGRAFYSNDNFNIIPDAYVLKLNEKTQREPSGENEGDEPPAYGVFLNEEGLPRIKLSSYYQSLLKSKSPDADSTRAYLEEKYRSARWLVSSIEQRNRTIIKVAESILKFQRAFMDKGVSHLRPLVLKQVAEDIEMHESTVSRVTTNKYIHTPQGIYEFKFFFNGSLQSVENESGGMVSSIAVRKRIERMVSEENSDAPLTDQEIVKRLEKEGVKIARRTVNKYRVELNIGPAAQRKRVSL